MFNALALPVPKYRRASSAVEVRRYERAEPTKSSLWASTVADKGGIDDEPYAPPQIPASHPISCLPTELLSQIFEHCLSDEPFPAPAISSVPLLLTHTCSHWRAVAFSTPVLWSGLHITYKDPSLDVPNASEWLARSGNLPLSLSLSIDFNEQPAQDILDVICSHSQRWRRIRLEFRGLYCPPIYSLALAEQSGTPNLHAFEFTARDISSANVTPIVALLNSSPRLREVTWVDDLADTRRLLELPLSRLTLLSITMSHGTLDYLELLHQCYNLEHIRITRPRPGDSVAPRRPLVLSKLTSLNIAYDLTDILDSLVLPALKHVRVHSENQIRRNSGRAGLPGVVSAGPGSASVLDQGQGGGDRRWSPVSFISLIERSSCAIESLSVDAPMTDSCLLDCLQMTSASLRFLSVAGVGVGDELVKGLTDSGLTSTMVGTASLEMGKMHDHVLCPLLREVNFNTRISTSPGVLVRMVESRLVSSTKAHSSHLSSHTSSPNSFFLRMWNGHRDLDDLCALRERSTLPSSIPVATDSDLDTVNLDAAPCISPPPSSSSLSILLSPDSLIAKCEFKLDVIPAPRWSNSRSRAKRYLNGRRRTCESR